MTKSYTYDGYGQRLSQTRRNSDGTSEQAWYGYNPHTDVETLTGPGGNTTATYGYTAYGKDRTAVCTGVDTPAAGIPAGQEPYSAYRFNNKRVDAISGDYDMGFRDYNPGLNRFLTRDMYNGALADMALGLDPRSANLYAFAGGNPSPASNTTASSSSKASTARAPHRIGRKRCTQLLRNEKVRRIAGSQGFSRRPHGGRECTSGGAKGSLTLPPDRRSLRAHAFPHTFRREVVGTVRTLGRWQVREFTSVEGNTRRCGK